MKNLAEELKIWFENNKLNRNKWNNNEIGKLIKTELIKSGNWKGAKRGDWKKGAQMREYSSAIKNGYDGPPPFKPKSKYAKFYQTS